MPTRRITGMWALLTVRVQRRMPLNLGGNLQRPLPPGRRPSRIDGSIQ